MEASAFVAPLTREEEVIFVSGKLIRSEAKEFIEFVGRSSVDNKLIVSRCSKKALGVKNLTKGAHLLLVGEQRIAHTTNFIDETGGKGTHESGGFSVSNIISLDESDDLDFDAMFSESAEPQA